MFDAVAGLALETLTGVLTLADSEVDQSMVSFDLLSLLV